MNAITSWSGPTRRTAIGLISTAAMTLTVLLAGAGSASAAGPVVGSNSGGANFRSCPNVNCTSNGYRANGTAVNMICWRDAQWVYPPLSDYGSNRWFWASSTSSLTGWIHSSLVENQISVGMCP